MEVIVLDQRKRRQANRSQSGEGPGKVLWMDQLSDAVVLRVVKRQAARELEQLNFILQVTGGDPMMLPTLEQMEEIYNGTIEF